MASTEPYLASVDYLALNFVLEDWAACAGSSVPISQNDALFSLIGTFYGGNGTTYFLLPDLQGRVPVGEGQGAGLSAYDLGEETGAESVTLGINQMPQHIHTVQLGPAGGGTSGNSYPAASGSTTPSGGAAGGTVQPAGANLPFSILQPSLALSPQICLEGVFPQRY